MGYRVLLSQAARRDLQRTHGPEKRRIADAIEALAEEPRPHGAVKLEGDDDLYRVRVRNFRIVYTIEDDRLLVLVVRVGHRKDIYRDGT